MESGAPKLSVWTEGLDGEWKVTAEKAGLIDRGSMELGDVAQSFERIWAFNGDNVDCQMGLEYKSRELQLRLEFGKILASDPHDMNYQGVEVVPAELVSYLESHFEMYSEEEEASNPIRLIEWCVLGTFMLILGFSLFYMNRFLNMESGFLPLPKVVEFDEVDAKNHVQRYAGIYTTRVKDGGMAIELKPDGTYGYYDLSRSGPTVYRMIAVNEGDYRAVLLQNKLALLTDNRFVFTPSGKAELEFLQRKFDKVGTSRSEVPFLRFPE